MPDYRRYFVPGATYFFTVVTDGRRPLFARPEARNLLRQVTKECRDRWPFSIDAVVLLPDHWHALWTLPTGDEAYPTRLGWLKKEFTKRWLAQGGNEATVSEGRSADGRRGVWQPKYWEHTIRDETDFENHADYIHYNPVKHGYVTRAADWLWSSFHKWVGEGVYDPAWGTETPTRLTKLTTDFGE